MSPQKDETLCRIISKNIRELRLKKFPGHGGQTKCATKFDVNVRTWNGWEAGRNIPSEEYQRKLAVFFSISVAQLRGDLPLKTEKSPVIVAGDNEIVRRLFSILAEAHKTLAALAEDVVLGKVDPEIALPEVEEALSKVLQVRGKQAESDKRRSSASGKSGKNTA